MSFDKEKMAQLAAKVNPKIARVSNSLFLKTLMAGTMGAFPAIITGSFASVLLNIQITAYQNFLEVTGIKTVLNLIFLCTVSVFALYIVFGIAYNFAKNMNCDPLPSGILAIAAFLVVTPFNATATEYGTIDYALPTTWLGGSGNITALIVGFLVGAIYCYVTKKGWTIKLPDSVPPVISSNFKGIVPGIIILGIFGVIATVFSYTPFGSLHQAIYSCLQAPLQGITTNIWTMMFVTFLANFLWMFGIHGPMVVIPIMSTFWSAADLESLAAFTAGESIPHIAGMAFFQVATFSTGAVGLAICMVLFSRSRRYKTLGKLSIVPSIFGITEPLIFGTPIVMNLKMLIPQTLVPTLSVGFTYLLTISGILPRMSGTSIPTGTPVIVAGLLQGSWKFGVYHAVMIVIWTLMYFPFFKSIDNDAYRDEQALGE